MDLAVEKLLHSRHISIWFLRLWRER
jgi:hypothetical protein